MENQPIQLMIVDDHAIVRKGMKAFLDGYEEIHVIGEAGDGSKAVQLANQLNPDVILIDLMMPGMDGIETIRRVIAARPEQRFIVLTAYDREDRIIEAVRAGAMGYLIKNADPEELVQAIHRVYVGIPALNSKFVWMLFRRRPRVEFLERNKDLSEREIEVLRLLAKGFTDQEIAQELWLTTATVRTHISNILVKLGLNNRVQAVLYGLRSGMVALEETTDPNKALY